MTIQYPPPFPTRRSSDLAVRLVFWPPYAADGIRDEPRIAPIERALRHKVHVSANRGGIHVRRRRLGQLNRLDQPERDRKSTRLNSSHVKISYAVFCLKKK